MAKRRDAQLATRDISKWLKVSGFFIFIVMPAKAGIHTS
jgi:hypothetical protein